MSRDMVAYGYISLSSLVLIYDQLDKPQAMPMPLTGMPEITEEMINAGIQALLAHDRFESKEDAVVRIFMAMVEEAPSFLAKID